jgi:hypothetical protein
VELRREIMNKVKTFTTSLKAFHIMEELKSLDEMVSQFIEDNNVKTVVAVSDAATSDNTEATIGLI